MGRGARMGEFGNIRSNRDSIPGTSTQQRVAIPTPSSRSTHFQGKYSYFFAFDDGGSSVFRRVRKLLPHSTVLLSLTEAVVKLNA